jgi:hypothetical protein
MRADMGKVLVERPRPGSREGSRPQKGYRKRLRKEFESGDPPARERMTHRSGGTRFFNEHLAPLRRFLNSNVGRPWDKVYSEICKHVDRGNVVQKHILTHLSDYVVTNVILIDGQPCRGEAYARLYGEPLRITHWRDQWYVCPKSGLLKRSRYIPYGRKRLDPPRHLKLNNKQLCILGNGRWELVTVALVVQPLAEVAPDYAVILQEQLEDRSEREAKSVRFHRGNKYVICRRLLRRKELLTLPIPIEWLS